ncbi:MAG: BACON domain-containing protein [Bacteroides sp.]|nr:BACON domain-containing protein [Bacteroides sp.]
MKKIVTLFMLVLTVCSCKEEDTLIPEPLYIGDKEVLFTVDAEKKEYEIVSNSPVTMKAPELDWCTFSLEGKKLTIQAKANTSIPGRETTLEFTNAVRSITVPVKQAGHPTTAIEIDHATADSEQPGETIDLSYDKNPSTFYHANWGDSRPEGTFELIYYLKGAPKLAMISYYPRVGGGNGTFGKISIYVSTVDAKEDFVKIMDYDCARSKEVSHIELATFVANTYAAKIIVDGSTSAGGFASCSEMEFYGVE